MTSQRKPIIAGNWKSNPKTVQQVNELCSAFNALEFDNSKVDVVICPTALHVAAVSNTLNPRIKVGTQNVSKTEEGAFTGEVTVNMVKDLGYEWTIIGHSERRHKFGETNEELTLKVKLAQQAGLKVMFCIGELLEERQAGKTTEVIKEQLLALIPGVSDWSRIVIAYEPVWAIGTGVVATPQQADEAHKDVRKVLAEAVSQEVADAIRIQYGGSVTPDNCKELMALSDVDGFLVGGASLKPSFVEIIKSAM
eukprot:GEMP01048522.1.p1 GENE.GEMP01048522.1~~GEMP01048522.1.p1  ORF type:complete len:252 (+),score=65.79 GEMP01048522.1:33-788(+)